MYKGSGSILALLVLRCIALPPQSCLADGMPSLPPEEEREVEPIQRFFPASSNGVPDRYIVALNLASAASAAPELMGEVGGALGYIFKHVFSGFEAQLSEEQAEALSTNPLVRYVIQDHYLEEEPVSSLPPHCYEGYDQNDNDFPPVPGPMNLQPTQDLDCSDLSTSGNCIDNWGLDRVDQDVLSLSETFAYRQAGSGIEVYVVDMGVDRDNREFLNSTLSGSRVLPGIQTQCTNFPNNPACVDGHTACASQTSAVAGGHGTHVAGIIGGRTFGLAKDVTIVPVKALCAGNTMTHHVLGLEWILIDHDEEEPTAIVNISGLNSLGAVAGGHCSYYDPQCGSGAAYRDAMIALAGRDNLLVVQSAGNKSFSQIPGTNPPQYYARLEACDNSFGDEADYVAPWATVEQMRAIARIVVAAGSSESDGLWRSSVGENGHPFGSTVGACVDIFAPAARINASFYRNDLEPPAEDEVVCQLSGTSMAAPHVSGVAAMMLETAPAMSARSLRAMLLNLGGTGLLESNSGAADYIGANSPNLLLHWDATDIFWRRL